MARRLSKDKLYLKKQSSRSQEASGTLFNSVLLAFHNFRERVLEQDFKRHTMTTMAMSGEKIAITFENAIIKGDVVIVIIAMENHIKLIKVEPITFLGVALGLINLADHSRVHFQSPCYRR